ncbi:MAG: 60S ribosomal protein L31 [Nanoarchaeota archaeon]|nr:60S ribosomal protein L31 [Nanoarchaeota archaeon]
MVEEKIYTVPLRKGFLKVPRYDRSRKAKDVLKEFLKKHLKKDVKIGKYLNLEIWKQGRQNPPSRVKIRIEESKDKIIAELINAPREKLKEEKKEIKKKKSEVAEKQEEEKKEETKKAIENVPEGEIKKVDSEKREAEPVEKEHAHRKGEGIITQRTGKTKSRTN